MLNNHAQRQPRGFNKLKSGNGAVAGTRTLDLSLTNKPDYGKFHNIFNAILIVVKFVVVKLWRPHYIILYQCLGEKIAILGQSSRDLSGCNGQLAP